MSNLSQTFQQRNKRKNTRHTQRLLRFIVGFEELCAIPCRGLPLVVMGFVQHPVASGRPRPSRLLPTSLHQPCGATRRTILLFRSCVTQYCLLKVCRADASYTRHTVPVYRYPFDLIDIPISRASRATCESHLAERSQSIRGVKQIEQRSLSLLNYRYISPENLLILNWFVFKFIFKIQ